MTDATRGKQETPLDAAARYAPWLALPVLIGGALIVWGRYGAPAVVLWFCFALLAGAILLFWESLRTATDPTAAGDEGMLDAADAAGAAGMAHLEERKRAALRALKDIRFEHSIRRLSDEDYADLESRYRAEARAAMEAIDKGLGNYLARAEELIARAEGGAALDELTTDAPAEEPGRARKNRKKRPGAPSVGAGSATESMGVAEVTTAAPATTTVTESAPAAPAEADAAAGRACGSCSTRNDADATFCKKCGTRLEAQA